MSFFGKKFKKIKVENVVEILDALKVPEKTLGLLKQTDTITCFEKNADGTIRYYSTVGDDIKFDQTITLGKESDYITPDGVQTKISFTLEGDILKSVMKIDGKVIHFDRAFKGSGMELTVTVEGSDLKPGIIYYEGV